MSKGKLGLPKVKKIKPPKMKRPKKSVANLEFKPSDILIKNREIFLYENINNESALRVIQELKALNLVNKKPITLWLNSSGGSVASGFAIINTIKSIKSKVTTIINSQVCSMGSLVAITGDERLIVKNGVFMAHDMKGGITGDYSQKVEDRAYFIKKYYKLIEEHLKGHTDLTTKEINRARAGELWLFADDCLDKGIVDKIIEA